MGRSRVRSANGLLYVNANEMAWILRLVPRSMQTGTATAEQLYHKNCANCHRADQKGTPPEFPSLVNLKARLTEQQANAVVAVARDECPLLRAWTARSPGHHPFLLSGENAAVQLTGAPSPIDQKFGIDGYNKFLDQDGYPAVKPPWGTLNAIDLNKGTIAWKIPFGEYPKLREQGLSGTGSENYGGPVVTSNGLLFIAATLFDNKIHAYDKANGKLLWETELPAGRNGHSVALRSQVEKSCRVASGGGKSGAPSGGSYVHSVCPTDRGSIKGMREHSPLSYT